MFGIYLNYYPRIFNGFYYSVQENDTLERISKRFKVSVNSLIMANNLIYPYKVDEGDILFIIGKEEPKPSEVSNIYTFREKDDLDSIAKDNKMSKEKILEDNYIDDGSNVLIGHKLLISKENTSNESTNYHTNEFEQDNTDDNDIQAVITERFPNLKRGDRGKYVFTAKRLMYSIGYKVKNMDAIFDKEFENSVKSMQKKVGLNQTGVIDFKNWQYIFNKINREPNKFV